MFSGPDFRLNARLYLPSLVHLPVCHGYSCACVCEECMERARPKPLPVRQPWEGRRAA